MKNCAIPPSRPCPPNDLVICLQLGEAEGKALKQWVGKFINAGPGEVLKYALAFMLLHPERFDDWAISNANYCKAEGLDETSFLLSRIAARYRTSTLKFKRVEHECQT